MVYVVLEAVTVCHMLLKYVPQLVTNSTWYSIKSVLSFLNGYYLVTIEQCLHVGI